MTTFLITGATGFIGSAVLRELIARGAGPRVRVLVRREPPPWMTEAGVDAVRGDLADASGLDGVCAGVATVLHLASRIGGDPAGCVAVNEHGTRRLLAEARRAGAERIIYLSTCGVYGMGVHRGQREDELVAAPVSATSRTRLLAEEMVRAAGGMVIRPHLVYGSGDRHVVPTLLRLVRGVPAWAAGGGARTSLIAVTDLAAAIAAMALMPWGQSRGVTFHADDTRPVRMRDLITTLCGLLGLPVPEVDLPVGEHRERVRRALPVLSDHQHSLFTEDHWYDSSRIWAFTGESPGPGLAARLPATVGWYRLTAA